MVNAHYPGVFFPGGEFHPILKRSFYTLRNAHLFGGSFALICRTSADAVQAPFS